MSYWNPGDQAFCTNGTWRNGYDQRPVSGPKYGLIYTVRDVGYFDFWDMEILWLMEFPGNSTSDAYESKHFIKLDPLEETDEDKEVIDIMKGLEVV